MIYKFSVRQATEHDPTLAGTRTHLNLPDLQRWRDFYIDVPRELSAEQVELLTASLGNGFTEQVERGGPLVAGRQVQVAYKRGIVDNDNDSIVDLCRLLGIPATAGKVATTYESADPRLAAIVEDQCCNPNIEEIHTAEPDYQTLQPAGHYEPMRTFDLRELSDEQLEELGRAEGRNLNLRQMRQIRVIQLETGAPHVTDVLLEAMDARWSDHCSHTTWKSLGNLLQKLIDAAERTGNPNIVSMFHDNAGVWDFYDGQCIAFKAETHNGPSAISAYFGQLTKLGGVLRDILGTGQGADPIGVFEYTATGAFGTPSPIAGRPNPQQIAVETIRAIKEYGNTFGVPMMWAHMTQHPAYRAKPFALGGCIGLVPKKYAQRGRPQPGDMLMLIGGLTGNDGIHGASASSAGSEMDTASVQIGSPLEEVKFCQAIIELRDADCLRALTDLGAAGLNSAVGEMGEACGVWLNTALVPLKSKGLAMWRILLSESQERMALAVLPKKLEEARTILEKHRVRNTVVGKFANTGRYTVVHNPQLREEDVIACDAATLPTEGEVGIDAPYGLLQDAPESRTPERVPRPEEKSAWPLIKRSELPDLLTELFSDPEIADQSFATSQYDWTVQGLRVGRQSLGDPSKIRRADADRAGKGLAAYYHACRPLYGKPYATLFTASFNPWLFAANPRLAARQCFLANLTAQVLAGVNLKDICLCDNFYTPHLEPGADWWLVEMVEELAALVDTFGTPLISGKDSSAGSTETPEGIISVPPAVFLTALGKVPDASKLLPCQWQSPGSLLVRIGPDCHSLAGTVAARVFDIRANDVDDLPPHEHRAFLDALGSPPAGLIRSGIPIGSGGILAAMFRQVLASGRGVEILHQPDWHDIVKEHRCGALVEVSEDHLSELQGLQPAIVGRILDDPLTILADGEDVLTEQAVAAWRDSYRESMQ